MKKSFTGVLICCAILAAVVECEAQDLTGKMSVRFIDPSCGDKPIKGVRVNVQSREYSKKVRTGSNGTFELALRSGIYTLFAQKYGFKKMVIGSVEIKDDSKYEQAFKMERGYASDDPNFGSPSFNPCKHEDKKID